MTAGVKVSVVVPTYRRPEWLERCLQGVAAQERPADEVIVVRRTDDHDSAEVLRAWEGVVRVVTVERPGQVEALHAGMAASRGDVVAFTDDDAVPRPDWLARLSAWYGRPDVGGVGGRDVIEREQWPLVPSGRAVRLTRWGKLVGQHHLGTGPAQDVDVLKGANMSFRREALSMVGLLRGDGAQVHNDLAVSLAARRRGWRLVYDPTVLVDHYPAPRHDVDQRDRPARRAVQDEAYNLVLVLLTFRRDLRWRRVVYGLLVGDAAVPGLARWAVAVCRHEVRVARRLGPSLRGQLAAVAAFSRGQRIGADVVPRRPSD